MRTHCALWRILLKMGILLHKEAYVVFYLRNPFCTYLRKLRELKLHSAYYSIATVMLNLLQHNPPHLVLEDPKVEFWLHYQSMTYKFNRIRNYLLLRYFLGESAQKCFGHTQGMVRVACKQLNLWDRLWSKMGVLWMEITYLKSAAMLFFDFSVNIYGLGLSNDLIFIVIAQGTTKLWLVQVGGLPFT